MRLALRRPARTGHALLVAATMVAVAACTADAETPPPTTGADRPDCDRTLHEALGAWERAGFSGSVAIATGGQFDCLAGYGYAEETTGTPNTPETVFSIGSVTKSFTAAGILRLAEDGALGLTDRAGELIPELAGPVAQATVEQLLLHTSGLNGTFSADYAPLAAEEAVAAIDALEVAFAPGTDFLYSNAGYTLLALIMERVAPGGYRDYLASTILPLPGGGVAGGFWNGEPAAPEPRATGYLEDGAAGESGDFAGPHWALDGNGGQAMTVAELATWTQALFTGQVVGPESVEIITTPGFDLGDGAAETPGWVAYDAPVFGEPLFTASGGGGSVGHDAVVAWVPGTGRVVAVASNRPEISAGDLLAAVAPALLAGDPLPTPPAPAAPSDPGAIVGSYQLDTGGAYEVSYRDGSLTVTARGPDAVAALFPPGAGGSAEDVADHEARVLSLLAGETREGEGELAALAEAFGPVTGVALAGSLVHDGELRSYVTITTAEQSHLGWYAVNRAGGIEAAEVPTDPPAIDLVAAGGERYRPDDPTGSGPDLTVEFQDGSMIITGPGGITTAGAAG